MKRSTKRNQSLFSRKQKHLLVISSTLVVILSLCLVLLSRMNTVLASEIPETDLISTVADEDALVDQEDPNEITVTENTEDSTSNLQQDDPKETLQTETEEEEELPSYEVEDYEGVLYASVSLNVRSGPTTSYKVIGYLKQNEQVSITGIADTGWYRIDYLGEEAFVSDKYMSTEPVEVVQVVVETDTEVLEDSDASSEEITELEQADVTSTQSKNYIVNSSIDGYATVFIGDSRTVGMYNAVKDNNSLWVAAVGKGRDWFVNYGSVQADPYIGAGTKVVINLGVNDTGQVNRYISDMNSICQTWIDRGAQIYYLSVNPLDYSKYVDNSGVESFNVTLSAGLSSSITWLDSYSYLMEIGYTTVDGIHYDHATSKLIYQFILDNIS